jgi:RimJ/RimL family protein N-acetyltransferase
MTASDPTYTITGERVALGPLRRDLVPRYTRWINDLGMQRTLGGPMLPRTIEQEEARRAQLDNEADSVQFTIYARATATPIGITELREIDWRARSATYVILIGEGAARGQGYGTETTRLVCDYGFGTLGLHSIMLTVVAPNVAGIRAYTRAGFRQFGRRRECRPLDGQLHDDIYMECLAREFIRPPVKSAASGATTGQDLARG